MILSRKDACNFVDRHYESSLFDINEVKVMSSLDLLTNKRLDLAFKLIYLDSVEKNKEYALSVYREHLKAFSLGSFKERGNESKENFDCFVAEFDSVFNSIKEYGYRSDVSLVPLSRTNHAINGAHRISSAIKLEQNIAAIILDHDEPFYDYNFFLERGVATNFVEDAVLKFIEYSDNTYIAFIWPSAIGHDELVIKQFKNIIYKKEIHLNFNGAHNLLAQLYAGEVWLGDCSDNYSGVIGKQVECFSTHGPVKIVVFQAENLDEVLNIKENVRKIFNIGKHSIHITDTKREAIDIARLILNKNGLHFLKYSVPTKYSSTYKRLSEFSMFLDINEIEQDDVIIDSGTVLSIYGIRDSYDIDYISNKSVNLKSEAKFESHDDLKYHKVSKSTLLYNPLYNFIYMGFKFVSIEQVYKLKVNRAVMKDIDDVSLIKCILESNKINFYKDSIRQHVSYFKVKLKIKVIEILKAVNLFNFFYAVYKKLKGK